MIYQGLHKLLIILFLVISSQAFAQDINRCTDLKTRKIIFSNEPCDPKTQRLVTVYRQEQMDKRLSTFNGAALVQQQKKMQPPTVQRPQQQKQQPVQVAAPAVDPSKPHRDQYRCVQINREKEDIAQRQRGGYTFMQGERYRARLRELSDQFTFYQCSGFDSQTFTKDKTNGNHLEMQTS